MDFISLYSQAGFALCKLHGKVPLKSEKGFPDFIPDPFLTAEDFPGNWGVVLKHEDLVIDVDPRSFKPDDNPLKRFLVDCGVDPESLKDGSTLVVRTGSGGMHIYFKKPADAPTISFLNAEYPGLQFKSYGGYVVGAGSTHPDTQKKYTNLFGSTPDRIAPCPASILERLAKPVEEPRVMDEAVYDDSDAERARFVEWLAQQPPTSEGARRPTLFKIAAKGRDLGLSEVVTHEIVSAIYHSNRVIPPLSDSEFDDVIKCAYKYAHNTPGVESPQAVFTEALPPTMGIAYNYDPYNIEWDMDTKGTAKKTLGNCINYMMTTQAVCESIRYNCLTYGIEVDGALPWSTYRIVGGEWDDNDALQLKTFLNRKYRLEFSTAVIHEAAATVAMRRHYHPVKQYLESLKWDRTPRINNWLSEYCGVDANEYTRAVGRKILLAAVARVYSPGIKFDYVPVIEGTQGIGKSTLVKILGDPWYADLYIDPRNVKETVDAMRGKWIVEISEMEVLRRADNNALKAFISKQTDRCRMAYARTTLDYPRQCVFMGTINPTEGGYLSDETGNRRYWPVYSKGVRIEDLRSIRDQLWAEAYFIVRTNPEPLYLDDPIATMISVEVQDSRCLKDPWVDFIRQFLRENKQINEITAAEVLLSVFGAGPKASGRADLCRVGRAMKELGWGKHRHTPSGGYFYRRPIHEQLQTL